MAWFLIKVYIKPLFSRVVKVLRKKKTHTHTHTQMRQMTMNVDRSSDHLDLEEFDEKCWRSLILTAFWIHDKSVKHSLRDCWENLCHVVIFLCYRHPQKAGLKSQNGCPKIDGWKRGKDICNSVQKWVFYKPQTVRSCHGWKPNNQSPSNFDMQPLFVDG